MWKSKPVYTNTRSIFWTHFIALIIGIIMGCMMDTSAFGHDWHMWDVQQLTSVRMTYCEGYMLAETKELGILLIEKVGDMNHNNLHIQKVDEYECVYGIEPLTLED